MLRLLTFTCFFILTIPNMALAHQSTQVPRIAVLDFGDGSFGRTAADTIALNLKHLDFLILDRDQSRAAAKGIDYKGSLNLELMYARDLGSALGCEFYVIGDAQSLRRSRSDSPAYFEAYASLFLVSARTGKLVMWDRPSFEAQSQKDAELKLFATLAGVQVRHRLNNGIHRALEDESIERAAVAEPVTAIMEEAQDEPTAEAEGLRLPRPFRRLRPQYPDSAARADAEGTVDALAEVNAKGEVTHVEIVRWAGFGLDQATIETIRKMHFFPAQRNGVAVPVRVLLRYNFRKPPRT